MGKWSVFQRQRGFRMLTASLLVLAALILFGVPSAAEASPIRFDVDTGFDVASPVAGHRLGTGALRAVPVAPTNGCVHDGGSRTSGCCTKAKCPLAHSGIASIAGFPTPSPETSTSPQPSSALGKGITPLPTLKPPRPSA